MSVFDRLLGGPRIGCVVCHKSFRAKLTDEPQPDGSLLRQFWCPHCNERYVVARISPRGRVLMSELQATLLTDTNRVAHLRRELKKEVHRESE
jgi:hypothetical protein